MAAIWARTMIGTRLEWVHNLAIAAVCGLFLGVVGPFGSYLNPSRVTVVAYWVGAMLLGELMIGLALRPARLLARRLGVAPLLAVAACTALVAIPLAVACHAVALLLWPLAIRHIGPLTWYGQTLVIATLAAAAHAVAEQPRAARRGAAHARAASGNFLNRLPAHVGDELIALQMEDHYVRAHTSKGSTLVLIPLRQALEELRGVPGLRVHRSWWVARHAVIDTVQDGRNVRLRLSGGLMAPVSRANVAAVRDAGIMAGG